MAQTAKKNLNSIKYKCICVSAITGSTWWGFLLLFFLSFDKLYFLQKLKVHSSSKSKVLRGRYQKLP